MSYCFKTSMTCEAVKKFFTASQRVSRPTPSVATWRYVVESLCWAAEADARVPRTVTVQGQETGIAPIEEIERALAGALDAWPMVRAAWLFGSVATGSAGRLSDVDVAVLGGGTLSFDERAGLALDLGRAAGRSCDVVVAEHASPVLAMAIVDTGRRFFCRDGGAADAWEEFVLRRYLGTAELRRLVYRYVRDDLLARR